MRIILISLTIFFWSLAGGELFALSQHDVEFTISCDKTKDLIKAQDPIQITFKLKNTGKAPLYVNKRFFLGQEEDMINDREVFLSVTSPSGQKLPYKYSYKTGFPKTDYFALLKPGEEAVSEYPRNINGSFEFSEPGEYKITATYQNAYGSEIGIDAFKDKIESNTITINISK
jgi:hypothetical protein